MHSKADMLRWLLASLLALTVACEETEEKTPDGGPGPGLTCNNDCKDFVLSKIYLPTTATASQYGWDFDGDGTPDNAMGSILGALAAMSSSFALQESLDTRVNRGEVPLLVRLQAKDFQNDQASKAKTWIGAKTTCCAHPEDEKVCATEAKTTCFAGNASFTADSTAPNNPVLSGTIAAGTGTYGPDKVVLALDFGDAGQVRQTLKAARIKGKIAADGKSISSGGVAGLIPKSELDSTFIPNIANMLEAKLNHPATEQQYKDAIKALFDANKDGHVSLQEVRDNGVIKAFLAGDVDVDKDGEKELSLGWGFEAVSGQIKP